MDEKLCMDKIHGAIRRISRNYPFYIPFTVYCKFVLDKKCSTMGINSDLIVSYNDMFLAELSDEDTVSVLLHEFKHVQYNHHARMGIYAEKIPFHILNIAADMEINSTLKERGIKNFIPGRMILPDAFGYEPLKTFEYYLDKMMKDGTAQKLMQGSGGQQQNPQQQGDDEGDGQDGQDGQQQQQQQPQQGKGRKKPKQLDKSNSSGGGNPMTSDQRKFSSDCNPEQNKKASGGNHGMDPEKLKRLLDKCVESEKTIGNTSSAENAEVIKPKKIPWKWDVILNRILTSMAQKCEGLDFYSYSRPARRTMAQMATQGDDDMVIMKPSFYSYKYDMNVAIIFDVSGSMFEEKKIVYGMLRSIKDKLSDNTNLNITILETDTEVVNVIKDFDPDLPIKSVDGGGTHMPAGWEYIMKNKLDKVFDFVICMTDGYSDWVKNPPLQNKSAVLWTGTEEGCTYKQRYHITFGEEGKN
jgi:predicted metal-dependent peptidase